MESWNEKLTTAARYGDIEALKLCLQNGADIDYQDEDGWTALMKAAKGGDLEVCKLLIDRGCKIDITADWGWTALMSAAEEGHLEVCRLLIDRGCKIDITDNSGYTALHCAALGGHLQTTRCLVEQGGANPLVTTRKGETPYDLAAEHKLGQYEDVMKYLQEMTDPILTKLRQLNRNDFQDLVALGTFSSYENRVFLAGPCNIGKSSLASILIGEEIPKTWISTDGLIIHFGRNGIDLQQRKMIPLEKEIKHSNESTKERPVFEMSLPVNAHTASSTCSKDSTMKNDVITTVTSTEVLQSLVRSVQNLKIRRKHM